MLSRLGRAAWKNSAERLRKQFVTRDGRLYNERLLQVRAASDKWHENQKQSGKLGADKRWRRDGDPIATPSRPYSEPIARARVSSSSSSSSSSSTSESQNHCASGDARGSDSSDHEPETPPTDTLFAMPVTSPLPKKSGRGLTRQQEHWFKDWWPIYWLHKSKKPAEVAFGKHVTTEDRFQLVMSATRAQAAEMFQRETGKRPYGASWLNDERWEDPADSPAAASCLSTYPKYESPKEDDTQ